MYDPWGDLGSRVDVTFAMAELPQGDAWWLPDERGIVIDPRLGRVARRCALAHELAHVDGEDTTSCVQYLNDRQERRADEVASRRLIDVHDLAAAIAIYEWPEDVAEHLDVTEHALRCRLRDLSEIERRIVERRLAARNNTVGER